MAIKRGKVRLCDRTECLHVGDPIENICHCRASRERCDYWWEKVSYLSLGVREMMHNTEGTGS